MFGVFMRKWKPKRISNNERNESPETDGSVSPEPPDRPPGKPRQIHPEDKTQVLAYESSYRKKNKPKTLPIEENHYNHLANTNVALSPIYPLTPNICVEGGKIEFIKSPPESARNSVALVSPPETPLLARRGSREKRDARIYDEPSEKFDGDKELLEKRVKQLEVQLDEEKRKTQRERLAVTKLQNKLIKDDKIIKSASHSEGCIQDFAKNDIAEKIHEAHILASTSDCTINKIYNDTLVPLQDRGYDFIAKVPTLNSCKTAMYNKRNKSLGVAKTVFRTLEEVEVPKMYSPYLVGDFYDKNYYEKEVRILVFISKEAKNILAQGQLPEFFIDGTFDSCPTPFAQLFTIHGNMGGSPETTNIIPLVYALLSDKREVTIC